MDRFMKTGLWNKKVFNNVYRGTEIDLNMIVNELFGSVNKMLGLDFKAV